MLKVIISICGIFFGVPLSLYLIDADDQFLEESLGVLSPILSYAVPKNNIPDKPIKIGVFESSMYLTTSIIEPISTSIQTSEGTFVVKGNVSGIKGTPVTLHGLSDTRLKNKLCIGEKCYKLIDSPGKG